MASQPFLAVVIGIPHIPTVTEINVRTGPGTNQGLAFKSGLQVTTTVQDVQVDMENKGLNGKIYQWFKVVFPDSQIGWVRDDLIEIVGDGTRFGYGNVATRTLAFKLTRQAVPATPVVPVAPPTPAVPVTPVTTAPPTPAVPVTPVAPVTPAPTTPAVPATPTETVTPGKAYVISMSKSGANVRPGPSASYNPPITKFMYNQRGEVLEVKPDDKNASRFRWIRINLNGQVGWVREDFVRFDGDYPAFGLAKNDSYPAPMQNSWWVRDFNLDPAVEAVHLGWDLAANTGEPILAGPKGGTVVKTLRCTKCTPDRPSTLMQGYSLGDPSIFNDAGWGFGYGNYVIVRYTNDLIPESTKQLLASKNLSAAHIFVMYAHLHTIDSVEGQAVAPSQKIGTCGNTGNSEAAHLHLEVRASMNPNDQWANMRPNLLDPVVLFRR